MMPTKTRPFLVSITTTIQAERGPVWWLAEIEVPASYDDARAVDWIMDELADNGRLRCDKLRAQDKSPGVKVITSREPAIISANIIATVTLPPFRVTEAG